MIRGEKSTKKLSKQIVSSLKCIREQQFQDAIKQKDKLYLGSIYNRLSILDLIRLFYKKNKQYKKRTIQ